MFFHQLMMGTIKNTEPSETPNLKGKYFSQNSDGKTRVGVGEN